MEDQTRKAQVMSMFSERYDAWVTSQEGQTSAYEYERSFDEFMQQMGHELLQQSVGAELDERKKSLQSRYGKISVPKKHILCSTPSGFRMTAYWQEQCVYMGQQQVFEQASEVMERFTGTAVTAKQLERLCHCYGQLAEEHQEQQANELAAMDERQHYAMVDGGMVLTREDDWRELNHYQLEAGRF